jgi:hypothetical protein
MAVALDADGRAWYPFTTVTGVVLFAYSPELPHITDRWATLPDDDPRPHIRLDLLHIAQLMLLAPIAPDAVEDLPALLAEQLAKCHCNPDALLGTVAAEFGSWPEQAASHMSACLLAAARHTGIEV